MKSLSSSSLSFLWLLAFVCALFPVNAWQLELSMVSVLLVFTWAAALLYRQLGEGFAVPKAPVLIFAGLFWLLAFASIFWSAVKPISVIAFCFFSIMPLTFFTGTLAAKENFFIACLKPLAVIFGLLAFWAAFQFFFLNAYFMGQARHPLADPSSLGALLSMPLFCCFAVIVSDRPEKKKRYATILGSLLVCGIIATVARGPVFAFLPAFGLFCWLLWSRVRISWRRIAIIFAVGIAFYGLTLTGIQKTFDLGSRLSGTVSGEGISNRIAVWTATLEMIKDRPLLGTGFGTFSYFYPQYRLPTEVDGVMLAHNDPLQFWTELGALGPLLFYAFLMAAAFLSFSSLKKEEVKESDEKKIVTVTVLAALGAMVTQSHVGFMHYNMSILFVTGFLLAAWFRATEVSMQEAKRCAPAQKPARVLAIVPFALLAWLYASIMIGEHYANKARDNLFREEMFEFAENINNADRVSNGLNFRAFEFAVNVPMAILEQPLKKLTDEDRKKYYDQVIWYMNEVEAINPRDPAVPYYRGKVQEFLPPSLILEGTPSPTDYYRDALRLDPAHLGARLALLNLYRKEKKSKEEMVALLEEGINFRYNTPLATEYYTALAHLYLETGQMDKAKEAMTRLYYFQKRSDFSKARQDMPIWKAIFGGNREMPNFR
jgi:O-antigen ligase